MNTQIVDLCPHCRQPMPKDALTHDPKGSAPMKCDVCPEQAAFIQHGRALCFAHAEIPALPRVMNNFFNRHKLAPR